MICKHCGYQNNAGGKYCPHCGQRLVPEKKAVRKILGMAAVCLLIIGIGIWKLIPKDGSAGDDAVKMDQILPMEEGAVAVLYSDGTVTVAGNPHFSQEVSGWNHVTRLFYDGYSAICDGPLLAGVTESGSVVTTEGALSGWSDVDELHFPYEGIVGVTGDGRVLTYGTQEDDSYLSGLTDVEALVYSDIQDMWGCLKKDGSVCFLSDYTDPNAVYWTNVKELRDSGHGFYAIMKDGTVDGQIGDTYAGLKNAVKVVHYNDWVFGISADGRLLTQNNGSIYTNAGYLMVDTPGSVYYAGEVDIRQFDQVQDILAWWGLILLNKDGTVDAIGDEPQWDLSDWDNIEKVCGSFDPASENTTLYGLKRDGSVIMTRYHWGRTAQTVTDSYRGWRLQAIYSGSAGVVGLTTDGKLVGDGAYENVDFSVFDR